jgi:hypothetical protein
VSWITLYLDLRPHGQAALSVVAQEDPSTFVKVAASIVPKAELTMREVSAKDLSNDALAAIAVGGDYRDRTARWAPPLKLI